MTAFCRNTHSAYDGTRRGVLSIRPTSVLNCLYLETTRLSATTGTLEFAALGDGVGLLVLVRAHAKVFDSLTGVLLAPQEDRVGSRRCA